MSIIEAIASRIARAAGVTLDDLRKPSRAEPLPFIRQLIMWAGIANGATYKGIGRYLERDHATVHYGVRRMSELLGEPSGIRAMDAETEMALLMRAATPPREPPEVQVDDSNGAEYSILDDGLIIALVGFGYPDERIGRFVGRSRKAVCWRREVIGASRLKPRTDERDDRIVRAWLSGNSSFRKIGADLRISRSTVASVVNRRGLLGKKGTAHVQ